MEHKASVQYGTERFNLRAAALIIKGNRLLVCKNKASSDLFYTVGGGVRVGETTEEAVVREVLEETGRLLGIDRLVFVQERFFLHAGTQHHEVVFFYRMKGDELQIADGTTTDQESERLMWMPFDLLNEGNMIPAFLPDWLYRMPDEVVHIVSKDETEANAKQ